MKLPKFEMPVRTSLLYLLFGSLWILLSDQILFFVLPDSGQHPIYQTLKGWFFILVSSTLLYILLLGEYRERKQAGDALRESEQNLRNFINNSPDIIYLLDLVNHTNKFLNRNEFLGYSRNELEAPGSIMKALHADDIALVQTNWQQMLQIRGTEATSVEYRLKSKYGDWEWIHQRTTILSREIDGVPRQLLITLSVITERKHAEVALKRYAQNIEVLYQLSQKLHTILDLDEVYEETFLAVRTLMSCDAFTIALLDETKQEIDDVFLWDQDRRWPGGPHPIGPGLTSYIINSAQTWRVNQWDDTHAQKTGSIPFGHVEKDTNSVLAVPLFRTNGTCFGMISAQSYDLNAYSAEQEQLLITFANQVSNAIENAQLFNRLQQELTERRKAEQALRESESLYRQAIEVAGAVPYYESYYDEGRRIKYDFIGEGIRQITGYGPDEFNATLWDSLLEETVLVEDLAGYSLDEAIERVRGGNNPIWKCEHRICHRNGEIRWVFEAAVELRDEHGVSHGSIGMYQDITERKQAEEQIQNQLRRLNALHTVDMAINSSANIQVTLEVLLNQMLSQLNVDAADVLLFNQPAQTLELIAERGFRSNTAQPANQRLGDFYTGQVINQRRTFHIQNLMEAGKQFKRTSLLASETFTDYVGVPLIIKGQIKGVFEIYQRSPLNINQDWLNFLEVLSQQAAIAIDNSQLLQGLQRSNMEIILAYDATIAGWSRAMDLRDKETEGHTQRVTTMTLKLARAMGIHEADIVHIQRGGLLHDIGKLGVPDNILLKAGELTKDEWEIMRQHPTFAFNMLAPIAYLKNAIDIPYCHHEKWNGMGYPRGLKGEQIPLAARIFAVADVWDALTSDRPYRQAWSQEHTIEFIKEQSGKHFDPQAVEAFLRMIAIQP